MFVIRPSAINAGEALLFYETIQNNPFHSKPTFRLFESSRRDERAITGASTFLHNKIIPQRQITKEIQQFQQLLQLSLQFSGFHVKAHESEAFGS